MVVFDQSTHQQLLFRFCLGARKVAYKNTFIDGFRRNLRRCRRFIRILKVYARKLVI